MSRPAGRTAGRVSLDTPLPAFAGWASKSLPALRRLGLVTVGDLIHHYPRRYIDRSNVAKIGDLRVGQEATFIGAVRKVKSIRPRPKMVIVTARVYDGTGYADLSFFNQPWRLKQLREGQEVAAWGKVGAFRGVLQLQGPGVEVLKGGGDETVHAGRIVPLHPAGEGVTTGVIRRIVYDALDRIGDLSDPVPGEIRDRQGLLPLDEALRLVHFPDEPEDADRARDRLKFDELFFLELGVAFRKHRVESEEQGVAHDGAAILTERFLAALPFEPTTAQRGAMAEIATDMAAPRPMHRLLQGDVGSGKTVVALHAALRAVESGHQAAIMAPTEVLAQQHFRKIDELLAPMGARRVGETEPAPQASLLEEAPPEHTLTYALLTASVGGKQREAVLAGLADGSIDLLVGTHALVQEGVELRDLSLAVIDEQHRFGLHQRIALKEKGARPDVLIMTATPIPRTLALTYYGDLDVSVLDEMPAGRQPIQTRIARSAAERRKAYELVRQEVTAGRQAFVVCAAIDEGNRLQVKAAEKEAERLANEVFPDLDITLLHGKMKPREKDERMERFRSGASNLLIATTVIEVGVDIPNATVMLIENAERFGLAQLHQLRGRIGRGAHASYAILFDEAAPDNEEAKARLGAMVRTTDGFELADEDLRLRGEGTLFDIQQSGMPDLKLARLAEDTDLVRRARKEAFAIVGADPTLERSPELRAEMERRFADSIDWLFHS